jgi:hypothetical protein
MAGHIGKLLGHGAQSPGTQAEMHMGFVGCLALAIMLIADAPVAWVSSVTFLWPGSSSVK